MTKKIKVLTISDHPLSPSGVGTQTKYMIEALLQSGRFEVVSLGGAIKHPDYKPQKTEQYGDDWIIFPVDGYGSQDVVRSIIRNERPDMLWFMTDPRFYGWLWDISHEIRPHMPMVYYHVWDNWPAPRFNKKFYDSNDVIYSISKLTNDIVTATGTETEVKYLPHAVDETVFKPITLDEKKAAREQYLPTERQDNVVFFWNNRNARRKMSGSVLYWFVEWAKKVGTEKVTLIMHTDPKDMHGQDLIYIIDSLNATDGVVSLSTNKYPPEQLAEIYSLCDCTINVSDAEGFGLATLESLSCGVPIVVNMTGGLQEQVTDGENWFGIGIEPASKAIIGSQEVPFIYEDRVSQQDFADALDKIYNMTVEQRQELGLAGAEHVRTNYGWDNFRQSWIDELTRINEEHGSWENRKNYTGWEVITL